MKKLLAFAALCLMMAVAVVSCSSSPEEALAKQAMECLKDGEPEGFAELLYRNDVGYANSIVQRLEKNHNGIAKYSVQEVRTVSDNESWIVSFEITDGNGETIWAELNVWNRDGRMAINNVMDDWYD